MRRLIGRWRRRREPGYHWRVAVRIEQHDWLRISGHGLPLHGLTVDLSPPAGGPEVELSFTLAAGDRHDAIYLAELALARYRFPVLASKARPTGPAVTV